MSLQTINLRKILKIIYLPQNKRTSAIRTDIRADIAKARGFLDGGGDFYGPFWKDAKGHVFNEVDLKEQARLRIEANPNRTNLYPRLCDGFLLWWDERRRWTNQPFMPADPLKATCRLPGIDAVIKFTNILSVRDGNADDHFVYPYWFPDPAISEEAARIALWALCQAFPTVNPSELRLLDVMRGQTFSIDRNALQGNEEAIFPCDFNRLRTNGIGSGIVIASLECRSICDYVPIMFYRKV